MIRTILLITLLSLSLGLNAQTRGAAKFLTYFKKGIGISYMNPLDAERDGARVGFHIGFAPSISIGNNAYIKPEFAYSGKGGKVAYNPNDGVFDGDVKYKVNYLELPVVYGYKLNRLLNLEVGAYGAIPVSLKFDYDGQFAAGYGELNKDEIHSFDYGLIAGIKIGPIGIRYYYGLTEIADTAVATAFLGEAKQQTIQIYFQRSRVREGFSRK